MKLTIFAATGGIGRQLLKRAVAAAHDVTASGPCRRQAAPDAAQPRPRASASPIPTSPSSRALEQPETIKQAIGIAT